jgi:hypothetical protein
VMATLCQNPTQACVLPDLQASPSRHTKLPTAWRSSMYHAMLRRTCPGDSAALRGSPTAGMTTSGCTTDTQKRLYGSGTVEHTLSNGLQIKLSRHHGVRSS